MASPTTPDLPARSGLPPTMVVRLDLIDPSPYQPRTMVAPSELEDLARSIEREGLIQPVAVRRIGDRFQLIAGHRRTAALRLLTDRTQDEGARDRWSRVPVVVISVTDEQASVMALTENVARVDLNPVEVGDAIFRVQEKFGLATDELASRVGLPVDRVKRLLRLRAAPKLLRDAVSVGILVESGEGEGRGRVQRKLELMGALELQKLWRALAARDPKHAEARFEAHLQRVLSEGWSIRRIQTFCRAAMQPAVAAEGPPPLAAAEAHNEAPDAPPAAGRGPVVVGSAAAVARVGVRVATLSTGEHRELGVLLEELSKKGNVVEILRRLAANLAR